MVPLQPSLFSSAGAPAPRPLGPAVRRTVVGDGAWVDVRRDWMAGAHELFEDLLASVRWRSERRRMYDRVVDVPRLQHFADEGDPLPHPVLARCLRDLSAHYLPELGEPLRTVGLALYRDGRDSVAWHGDTVGRASRHDTVVAILSLGATRRLLLRPRRGGPGLGFDLAGGDLLVMGGSCQRTWEHAVPKTARPVGPRCSVQFRTPGVR